MRSSLNRNITSISWEDQLKKSTGYTSDQIKALLDDQKPFVVILRLHAVSQVSVGHPSREVAQWYQVSFKQVLNWVHRLEEDGLEGLKDRPGQGRNSRLSPGQLQRLQYRHLDRPVVNRVDPATFPGYLPKSPNLQYP